MFLVYRCSTATTPLPQSALALHTTLSDGGLHQRTLSNAWTPATRPGGVQPLKRQWELPLMVRHGSGRWMWDRERAELGRCTRSRRRRPRLAAQAGRCAALGRRRHRHGPSRSSARPLREERMAGSELKAGLRALPPRASGAGDAGHGQARVQMRTEGQGLFSVAGVREGDGSCLVDVSSRNAASGQLR